MNARWLVLTDGSAPVRSPYDQAARVILERPKDPVAPPPEPPHETAILDVSQLQDPAESADELLSAIGGAELRFRVGVEVRGELAEADRAGVDEILREVAEDLKSG